MFNRSVCQLASITITSQNNFTREQTSRKSIKSSTGPDSSDVPIMNHQSIMCAYLYHSPVGIHIRDHTTSFPSDCPAPISTDPEKASWASPGQPHPLRQMLAHTPSGAESFNLLIYNKTRDTDRICPSCRRWYYVGEPKHFYGLYDDFLARGFPSGHDILSGQREEQDLSGICSRTCQEAMVQDDNEIAASAGRIQPETAGYVLRRTTVQEQAVSDIQFVWEKRTA